MNEITVFHHLCPEGNAGSAIIKQLMPHAYTVAVNYGRAVPWYQLVLGQTVYIVDFGFSLTDMIRLNNEYDLFVFDHHGGKIEEYKQAGLKLKGFLSVDHCGCGLTWRYFYPDTAIPLAIQLLESFDLWKFDIEGTLDFDYGLRTEDYRVTKSFNRWCRLFENKNNEVQEVIDKGKQITRFLDLSCEIYAKDLCFDTIIDGHVALVANTRGYSSLFFKSIIEANPDKYDVVILFAFIGNVGKYRYSIFQINKEVDVSKIARLYSGNGHKGASGWTSIHQVLDLNDPEEHTELVYEDFSDVVMNYLYDNDDKPYATKYAANSDRISLNSQWFDTEFEGKRCYALNHISTTKDIFNPIIDAYTKVVVLTFVWCGVGRYKIITHNTDLVNGLDLHKLAKKYNGKVLFESSYDRYGKPENPYEGVLWFYCKKLPFQLKRRSR